MYRIQVIVIFTFIENRICLSFNKKKIYAAVVAFSSSLFFLTATILSRRMTCHVFVLFFCKICRHFCFSLSFLSYSYARISISQLYFLHTLKEKRGKMLSSKSILVAKQPMKIYRSVTVQDDSFNNENNRYRALSTTNIRNIEW